MHLERPFLLACVGIESDHGAVAEFLRIRIDGAFARESRRGDVWILASHLSDAHESLAFLIFNGRAVEYVGVVLPYGEVKKPCARTVGRRIPVCAADVTRENRYPRRLRRLHGPPVFVQAAGPIHLAYKGRAGKKFASGP